MTSLTIEELFDLEAGNSKKGVLNGLQGYMSRDAISAVYTLIESNLRARYPDEDSRPPEIARALGGGW